MMSWAGLFALALPSLLSNVAMAADQCTQTTDPIDTDRPDVTNSSIVVPFGSLQSENGINLTRQDGAEIFDGTNSRLRLGVAPCLEILVDLPDYTGNLSGDERVVLIATGLENEVGLF